VAYHDACYLGRHNGIYDPPRNILTSIPGVRVVDLPRSRERSFCCGAGGARMWMDENDGTRINVARTDEALALKPDLITAACPYCIAMLTDGVGTRRQQGAVGDEVQVTDVAQVLLRSTVTSQEDKP
jgi:Fe-S oxidoreductase